VLRCLGFCTNPRAEIPAQRPRNGHRPPPQPEPVGSTVLHPERVRAFPRRRQVQAGKHHTPASYCTTGQRSAAQAQRAAAAAPRVTRMCARARAAPTPVERDGAWHLAAAVVAVVLRVCLAAARFERGRRHCIECGVWGGPAALCKTKLECTVPIITCVAGLIFGLSDIVMTMGFHYDCTKSKCGFTGRHRQTPPLPFNSKYAGPCLFTPPRAEPAVLSLQCALLVRGMRFVTARRAPARGKSMTLPRATSRVLEHS
jgi:hypothetical protein